MAGDLSPTEWTSVGYITEWTSVGYVGDGSAFVAPVGTRLNENHVHISFKFKPQEGKTMSEVTDPAMAQAIRTAAVQAVTLMEENAEDGSNKGTTSMIGYAADFSAWISSKDDKAAALEALNAAVVSLARSDSLGRTSSITAHANYFFNYITTGEMP